MSVPVMSIVSQFTKLRIVSGRKYFSGQRERIISLSNFFSVSHSVLGTKVPACLYKNKWGI